MKTVKLSICLLCGIILSACTPRIEVAAPKEPITINMNVKIEHQITIKADNEVQTLLDSENTAGNQNKSERKSPVETGAAGPADPAGKLSGSND